MKDFNLNLDELKGKSKNPYFVPDNYFNELPTRIQNKIMSESKKQIWGIHIFQKVASLLALGFMIVLFATTAIISVDFILSNRTQKINDGFFSRETEIDASEFSEEHFINMLLNDKRESLKTKEIETKHYINYLVNENIDYCLLMNEMH